MKKLFYIAASLLALVSLASCQEKIVESGEQYMPTFTYVDASCTQVILTPSASSFEIPVCRVDGGAEVEVPVAISGADSRLNIEKSVKFAAGSTSASIKGTYNISDWQEEEYLNVKIVVGNGFYASNLGTNTATIQIGRLVWKSLGQRDFIDAFIADGSYAGYGLNPPYIVKRELQYNLVTEGLYRFINPMTKGHAWIADGEYDATTDHNLIIDATDPAKVVLQELDTTVDWGDGHMVIGSKPGVYGTLSNGIITFPANGLYIKEGNTTYDANKSGTFKIDVTR